MGLGVERDSALADTDTHMSTANELFNRIMSAPPVHWEDPPETREQTPTGNKHDAGKPPMGKVMKYGAETYGANSWKKVRPGSRYLDAALRHLAQYAGGEDLDNETSLHHLAHADRPIW